MTCVRCSEETAEPLSAALSLRHSRFPDPGETAVTRPLDSLARHAANDRWAPARTTVLWRGVEWTLCAGVSSRMARFSSSSAAARCSNHCTE